MRIKVWKEFRIGLKQKTIATIVIVGSIPVLTGLGLVYFQGTKELRIAIGNSFQGLAQETGRKVDMVIEKEIEKIRQAAESSQVMQAVIIANKEYQGLSKQQIKDHLTRAEEEWNLAKAGPAIQGIFSRIKQSELNESILGQAQQDANYIALFVTDLEGALVASSNQYPDYQNALKPWWKKAHEGNGKNFYISDLYFDQKARLYAIEMSLAIMDEGDKGPIGIIKVEYNIKKFLTPAIHPVRFGKTGHAMLIDSDGNVIICPILATGNHVTDTVLMGAVSSPDPGWIVAESDAHGGKNSLVGFSPLTMFNERITQIGGKSWHSFIRQDPKELYVPIRNLLKWIAFSGASGLLGLGVMGYFAGNKLLDPIRKLEEGAKLIADGRLDHPIDIHTGDEIEQLKDSFEIMNRKLIDAFSGLEHKVEDRTKELKETQARLLQSERLASMGKVAASIGHELRNPLSVIKNSAYYLKLKVPDDPKLMKHLNVVEKEIVSSERIIDDLLNFTRSQNLVRILADMHLELNDVISSIEIPSGIALQKVFDVHMVPVRVDSDQMRRVFINLITNAIQVMDGKGELTITTRKKEKHVEVEIRDTGKGIEAQNIEKIFQPFFTTKAKGIGLGLALTKKIMDQHQGSIDLKSVIGKGATFIVSFPIVD